jgi:hypothetical protein
VYSSRPLTLPELAEAAIFDPDTVELDTETRLKDPEEILEVCGSLVSRTDKNTHVILAHTSVREYLVADTANLQVPYFHFQEAESNIEIAKICLQYLLLRNFSSGPTRNVPLTIQRIRSYPLLLYATHNWSTHGVKYLSTTPHLLALANTLLAPTPSPQFLAWVQFLLIHPKNVERTWHRYSPGSTPLYYASSFGLAPVVQSLVYAGVDLNARGGAHGGSALHGASWRGHAEIVRLLLEAGADPEVLDAQQMNPMALAIISRNEEIKELFRGSGISLKESYKGIAWSPRTLR